MSTRGSRRAGPNAVSIRLLLRYGLVGAGNTAASYAVYCLLIFLGLNYALASLGAIGFGIVLSFVTLGRYVFVSRLKGRFAKFVAVWLVLYFVNIALIRGLLSAGADAYLAGLIAAVPTVGTAFLLQRFYVFRQ